MAAPFLSQSSGKVYYEIEICAAEDMPRLLVGAAGTNFRSGQSGGWERAVGGDSLSWAVYSGDGDGINTTYTDGYSFHR